VGEAGADENKGASVGSKVTDVAILWMAGDARREGTKVSDNLVGKGKLLKAGVES